LLSLDHLHVLEKCIANLPDGAAEFLIVEPEVSRARPEMMGRAAAFRGDSMRGKTMFSSMMVRGSNARPISWSQAATYQALRRNIMSSTVALFRRARSTWCDRWRRRERFVVGYSGRLAQATSVYFDGERDAMKSAIAGGMRVSAALAAAATLIVATSSIEKARAESKIVEGFVSHGALQWPEYIANEFGWFKENGVNVDMVVVGPGAAQQVAAGSLNLAYSGFPDFIRATNQGAPLKIVINAVGEPPYAVYAKPAIKQIADLKGKTVTIGGTKDVTLIYMEAFIASAGLKASDLDFVYAKATQDRLAALLSGGADAAILYPPSTFRAGAAGYTYLGDIETYLKDFPFTVWAANTDWAAKNKDALLSYVKAYSRAIRWLYDGKNKDQAVDILVKYSKQDRKDSADTYDYFINKLHAFSADGRISAPSYKKLTDALVAWGDLTQPVPPMSKFFDLSFVDAAWQ
jgi:NitT/TauT family transport system substrate-binding protein